MWYNAVSSSSFDAYETCLSDVGSACPTLASDITLLIEDARAEVGMFCGMDVDEGEEDGDGNGGDGSSGNGGTRGTGSAASGELVYYGKITLKPNVGPLTVKLVKMFACLLKRSGLKVCTTFSFTDI